MDSKLRCVFEVPVDQNSPASKSLAAAQATSEFIKEEAKEAPAELSQVRFGGWNND